MSFRDLKGWHALNIIKMPYSRKILIKHLSIYEVLDLIRHWDDSDKLLKFLFL